MKSLPTFLVLTAISASGQQQHFPAGFLKASDFYSAGNDGCAQILAATTQSVNNGFGQSVLVDLSGDQLCAANPINSSFVGNLIFYTGATFHLSSTSGVAASWIIPSKVMITGAGDGVTTSASSDCTVLQACQATGPLCPTTFPTDTSLLCFSSCATNVSNLQGFSHSLHVFEAIELK
ncbi:MAG: hypothetical protein ACRD3T_14450 [Terriglobia bacterium]